MSRSVVLLELTCCAEEGLRQAQLRKETKYTGLVDEINSTGVWKASLFTLGGLCARSSRAVDTEGLCAAWFLVTPGPQVV